MMRIPSKGGHVTSWMFLISVIIVILVVCTYFGISSALIFIPFLSRLPTWGLLMNLVPSLKCWRSKWRHKISDALSLPILCVFMYGCNPSFPPLPLNVFKLRIFHRTGVSSLKDKLNAKAKFFWFWYLNAVIPVFNGQLLRSHKSPAVGQSGELIELKYF